MPLFDFHCPTCNRVFETLVRSDAPVVCPDCGDAAVARLQSMPARPAARHGEALPVLKRSGPPSGGGCCGGGGCCH